ncbi:spore coat protein [Oceanobacillus sp. J11TS1]|uniref:spore coat protein n=1 Tax=Oceanobacillus sp. J11TS1 TaxID=2807191 RepID=UPI001B0F667B|nr:spore coat protein [Oceanobacillus sp. J11TS1]GIO21543.1 hypothetical protein J11TS1_01240 [Oceanobacillus sp. J11TS1]
MSRDKCDCNRCRHSGRDEDVRVHPTRHEVRNHTRVKTVKNIYPTEVKNVNRTVVRNENYYPVRETNVNETVVENYDCGSDVNNSRNCRRVDNTNNCGKKNDKYSEKGKCEKKRFCGPRRNRHWFF